MWLSLFAVVLILATTFYLGLQGTFSALITCILTILSAALAFGLYENVYYGFLIDKQPEHGRGIALMAIFILTLLILRVIFDVVITGNMHFHPHVDRVIGGMFGFIAAMIIVGMLAIGFQMLPFGPAILGFSRYTYLNDQTNEPLPIVGQTDLENASAATELARIDWRQVKLVRHNVGGALNPDGFTVSLVSYLLDNSLGGANGKAFSGEHPEFLDHLFHQRVHPFGLSQTSVGAESLNIEAWWDLKDTLYDREIIDGESGKDIKLEASKDAPEPGHKRIVVRAALTQEAQDKGNFRFTPEQVRLFPRDSKTPQVYKLIGINNELYPGRYVRVQPGEGLVRAPIDPRTTFDFVFEVPEGATPWFLEFKENARKEILASQNSSEKPPAKLTEVPGSAKPAEEGPQTTRDQLTQGSGGAGTRNRVSGFGSARDVDFSNSLPFQGKPLTNYTDFEKEGSGELRGGKITAKLDDDWNPIDGTQPAITGFNVPEDKRMLQLSVNKLNPRSWLGNIVGGVVDRISDFYLVDEQGNKYPPVGMWAIAEVNREQTFELIYLDELARGMVHMPPFQKINTRRDMQDENNYVMKFLFHLPPGTRAVSFHTGRSDVDLRELNVVAPP